jgi:hypothetical protein
MQANENLTTLCGLSRAETELDFSGQNLLAGDAMLIANDISNMRALSELNLANNAIGGKSDGWGNITPTPEGRVICVYIHHLHFSYPCQYQVLLLSLLPSRIWGPYPLLSSIRSLSRSKTSNRRLSLTFQAKN